MATRSFIGYLKEDQSIDAIYCHWDGYPKHHLPILTKHYKSLDKIKDLIAIGPISVLAPEIGEKHSFYAPNPDWVISYSRDRASFEDKAEIITFKSLDDLQARYREYPGVEYAYIYQNNIWEVY